MYLYNNNHNTAEIKQVSLLFLGAWLLRVWGLRFLVRFVSVLLRLHGISWSCGRFRVRGSGVKT